MGEVIDFDLEKILEFSSAHERSKSKQPSTSSTTKRRKLHSRLEIDNLGYADVNTQIRRTFGNEQLISPSTTSTSSPDEKVDQEEMGADAPPRITLVDRTIEAEISYPLTEDQYDQFNDESGYALSPSTDGSEARREFVGEQIRLMFAVSETPLLFIKNKTKFGFTKTELLLSINLLDHDHSAIRREIHLARDLPLNKRPENLFITGPHLSVSLPSQYSDVIDFKIKVSYKIEILESVFQINTVDLISSTKDLLKLSSEVLPTRYDLSLQNADIDSQDPITPQVFYTAISDHTLAMPPVNHNFDIPELETQLFRFQRKTVRWLLERESVKYDHSSNRCVDVPLISGELNQRILDEINSGNVAYSELDGTIHETLSKICFGWSLISLNNAQYWYNCYTGNISSRSNVYKVLLQKYGSLNSGSESSNHKPVPTLPGKGLLAEEMGLGKTVELTALVILNQRPFEHINKPVQITLKPYGDLKTIPKSRTTLIISPESILKQWVEEVTNLAPSLAVTVYQGIDKYPKLNKNANLIAEYLKGFDIVFTTYSTISKELDYANYSSKKKKTRSAKRKYNYSDTTNATDEGEGEEEELGGDDDFSGIVEKSQDGNSSAVDDLDSYHSLFQLTLSSKKNPKNANERAPGEEHTDYEKALQDEIQLAIKHNKNLPDIYRSNDNRDYQTPLMLMEFWRVVLDEVQMVSSRMSRAFQSASLIPRHHVWGVSGTPIKKDFGDLHSILRFLRLHPLGDDYYAKMTWEMLTNTNKKSNLIPGNTDFVKLWSQISLRHTKVMVHDDIKLPPQNRILMSIPFNPVEQENYNQMFSECLAAICLDENGNPVFNDWEPTNTYLSVMRYWLVKLRQVCCNPQVGRLNLGSRRYKSRNHLFYGRTGQGMNIVQQLKTLENVLDDMLSRAYEQISEAEKSEINLSLKFAEFEESLLLPEKALETLRASVWDTERIICRLTRQLDNLVRTYKELSKTESTMPKTNGNGHTKEADLEDEEDLENKDLDAEDSSSGADGIYYGNASNVVQSSVTRNEKSSEIEKYKENINATRIRLRNWNLTLHKFYFLIASCHFQCYDEEYQKKVQDSTYESELEEYGDLKTFHRINTAVDFVSPLVSGVSTDDLKPIDALAGFQGDRNSETELHQFQEQFYYGLAEKVREMILESSIKGVQRTVKTRILSREIYFEDKKKFLDNGDFHIPKNSKKLFKYMPLIEIKSLEDNIVGMRTKLFYNKIVALVEQLNEQSEVINDWMDKLISILCKPLLTHDKTPDGAEYEESIDDQDKVSCYLHVLSTVIVDRSEIVLGSESSAKSASFKKQQDTFSGELSNVNNLEFLQSLQEARETVKPKSKTSLQDLALTASTLETDMKSEARGELNFPKSDANIGNLEEELFNVFSNKVRKIFENQKLAVVLLQKELTVNCNAVFNSRIEYFKQLQQISDSVKSPLPEPVKNIPYAIRLFLKAKVIREQAFTKSIAKYRYLQSLVKDEKHDKSQENGSASTGDSSNDEDDLMCTICRSSITIGSLTQCGHKYCKECLAHWLRNSHTCPMCKTHINESTIYNFTHHKPNLKANAVHDKTSMDGQGNSSSESEAQSASIQQNLHFIYKSIDEDIVENIQQMELKTSYSSKVDMIIKQVLYLKSQDPSVQIVIFSQWQDLLYIIGTALKNLNVSYLASHGTLTPEIGGGRRRNKYDSVEQFKKPGSEITCFLLNAKAQASGLTLINATHIFLCEPLVNTSLELQAISRIHRIGQTKLTTVWMFAIENTVEESIVIMSTNKRLQYFEKEKTAEAENEVTSTEQAAAPSSNESKDAHDSRELLKAESMTLMKSGGIDTLVDKSQSEGESVTNGDLWNAFFSASSTKQATITKFTSIKE